MNVYDSLNLNETLEAKPDVTCIGAFDGVHLGHQALINMAKSISSKYQILTFDPVPKKFFNNMHKLLSTKDMKVDLLSRFSPESIIFLNFEDVKDLIPEDFCNILNNKLNTKSIVVGKDFKFGKNREGDVNFLIKYFGNSNVHVLNDYVVNDSKISSTLIKSTINEGKLELANQYLGYLFKLKGKVEHGNHMGHKIGFPTANINVDVNLVTPKFGVYEVDVTKADKTYKGVMNIGNRPTVSNDLKLSYEVHILDFDEDIYGSFLEVEFVSFIRDEIKFDNIEELKNQISIDIESIKNK
jgi:riboflavin kinase/FMN adenylyltransferase